MFLDMFSCFNNIKRAFFTAAFKLPSFFPPVMLPTKQFNLTPFYIFDTVNISDLKDVFVLKAGLENNEDLVEIHHKYHF